MAKNHLRRIRPKADGDKPGDTRFEMRQPILQKRLGAGQRLKQSKARCLCLDFHYAGMIVACVAGADRLIALFVQRVLY